MSRKRFTARWPVAGVSILNILLTVLVLTTGCTNTVTPPTSPQKAYCEQFANYLASNGFEHGWVDVPEDYNNPQSPMIRVFYYWPKGMEGTPVAMYNGGPGYSSHTTFETIRGHQAQRTEWAKIPFVFIDQRGTGCSTPYPKIKDGTEYARYLHYSSHNIVRDSEKIREKLIGNRPWKVLGQSYGGMVVHRYVLDFPHSLVSAHVHGGAVGVYGDEAIYRRVKSQHRVLGEFLRRFPEDREVLAKLDNDLGEHNCYSFKASQAWNTEFCGPVILHRLITLLGFTDQWTRLHLWLADFLSPGGELNATVLQDFVDKDMGPSVLSDLASSEYIATRVIIFHEFEERGFTPEVCQAIDLRMKFERNGNFLGEVDECRAALSRTQTEEVVAEEEQWEKFFDSVKTQTIDLEILRDVIDQSEFAGKLYLYSGEHDTLVPKELFAEEVSVLGARVNYHHFPSSGHEGFLEPLVWKNLMK